MAEQVVAVVRDHVAARRPTSSTATLSHDPAVEGGMGDLEAAVDDARPGCRAPVEPPHAQSRSMPSQAHAPRARPGDVGERLRPGRQVEAVGHRRVGARVAAVAAPDHDSRMSATSVSSRSPSARSRRRGPPGPRTASPSSVVEAARRRRRRCVRPGRRSASPSPTCSRTRRSRRAVSRWTRVASMAAAPARRRRPAAPCRAARRSASRACRGPGARRPVACVVDERHGRDRARHVAGALGRGAVEARVGHDVGERDGLAGREDEAGDALEGVTAGRSPRRPARRPRPGTRAGRGRARRGRSRRPRRRRG